MLGVLLNAGAQLLLKAGTNRVGEFAFSADNILPIGLKLATSPPILAGMVCYGMSLVVWILALSRVPVSVAYPIWTAVGTLGTVVLGFVLLREPLTALKLASTMAIIGGVAGLKLSSA